MLKDMGCELAQGYLYSRPTPVEIIERLLGNTRAANASATRGNAASSAFA
jgi:EAL domain-containing protein (putative c-di-GMP-specific phosphodiesterase class I)